MATICICDVCGETITGKPHGLYFEWSDLDDCIHLDVCDRCMHIIDEHRCRIAEEYDARQERRQARKDGE